MTFHVKQTGTAKEIIGVHTKQTGTIKEVLEGWVKQGGVVKQFYYRGGGSGTPFGITPGNWMQYNVLFAVVSKGFTLQGYDDGTGPYTFQWSLVRITGGAAGAIVSGATSDNCIVEVEGSIINSLYEGTLTCEVTGTGPGGVTRVLNAGITVSWDEAP